MASSSDNERKSGNLLPKTQRETRRQRRQKQIKREKEAQTQNVSRPSLNLGRPQPSSAASRMGLNNSNGQQQSSLVRTQDNGRLRQPASSVQSYQQDDLELESRNVIALQSPLTPLANPRERSHAKAVANPFITPPNQANTGAKRRERTKKQARPADKRPISKPPEVEPKPAKPVPKEIRPFVYAIRLLILGVGIGAIAGTVLSAWDSTTHLPTSSKNSPQYRQQSNVLGKTSSVDTQESERSKTGVLPLTQEISGLKAQIEQLVSQNPKLEPGIFLIDPENGSYFDWEGTSTFSAASTIKVPILVAFFQDVDAGKIRLDEQLTIEASDLGGGSGDLQYKPIGTKLTALEVATKMIVISDNTATNMLIARLGGSEVLNQRFRAWGLTTTVIRNLLPDLEGTNTTTPKELASLMSMINSGNLVSTQSRDRMLDIMQKTVTKTLLPRGLDKGATIAHKTGDIGSLVGDVGLIDMPSGKRYIACVMVKRSHNNPQAQELIRKISRVAYQYFHQATGTPKTTPSPSGLTEEVRKPLTANNN